MGVSHLLGAASDHGLHEVLSQHKEMLLIMSDFREIVFYNGKDSITTFLTATIGAGAAATTGAGCAATTVLTTGAAAATTVLWTMG